MQYDGKFCVVCGRRIPALSHRKTTCSPFCLRRKKQGYAPYLGSTKLPFDDLTAIQEEAQKAGMTYGKYVAMKQQKESDT